MTAAIIDASGRPIAPPQVELVARPAGPWTLNRAGDKGAAR